MSEREGDQGAWARRARDPVARRGADWMNIPGILRIDVAKEALDDEVTGIGVHLEAHPPDLYHGAGGAAESN